MTDKAENIVREIVQTTLRMDAALHEALRDHVHALGKGLSKGERPSLDSVVQGMIRAALAALSEKSKKLTPLAESPGVISMRMSEETSLNGKLDQILELL